jgi:methionyl-tRNA formyltransferase
VTALRVAFAGTPAFARTALQGLLASRHALVGVLTRADRPRGRGQRLSASPVKEAALSAGLPLSQPNTLEEAALEELRSWRPDLLVVVAYGLILPAAWLNAPPLGSINVHASLLPRWRGAAPIQRALLAGDDETGVTLMRMVPALDAGPILLQRAIRIGARATSGSLHEELAQLGARTLLEGLDGLAAGRLQEVPQPSVGVSYARKVDKSEARIDWQESAALIERQVRAFNPWPMAQTRLEDEPLRIVAARLQKAPPTAAAPGTILALEDEALCVQCGEGTLGVTMCSALAAGQSWLANSPLPALCRARCWVSPADGRRRTGPARTPSRRCDSRGCSAGIGFCYSGGSVGA